MKVGRIILWVAFCTLLFSCSKGQQKGDPIENLPARLQTVLQINCIKLHKPNKVEVHLRPKKNEKDLSKWVLFLPGASWTPWQSISQKGVADQLKVKMGRKIPGEWKGQWRSGSDEDYLLFGMNTSKGTWLTCEPIKK